MKKELHLILDYYWWDEIDSGRKTVEYRDDKPYYRNRIKGKTVVVLHRGYSKKTMAFEISRIVFNDFGQIEFHLGKRKEE